MVVIRSIASALQQYAAHQPAPVSSYPAHWTASDWDTFTALAAHHRVVPLLAHHVQTGVLPDFPPAVMEHFVKTLHTTRLRHTRGHRALHDITSAFTDADVPHVPLKGPLLADEAYAAAGLRIYDDLDILVDPRDVPAAERILTSQGYALHPQSLPAWLVRRYHFHTQWVHPDTGQCIELHWRPADTRVLPRGSAIDEYVRELRERPAAMAIYLMVHLAKHTFAYDLYAPLRLDPLTVWHPWSGLRWIWMLDFQGLCAARALSNEQLHEAAERWHARPALAFVQYLVPVEGPGSPAPRHHTSRVSLRAAFLRRIQRELDFDKPPREPPWWLRANTRVGFRPARLIDRSTS